MPRAGLIVGNGVLPRDAILRLEIARAEFVLAADGGANRLLTRGIEPDAVLGDFDSADIGSLPEHVQRIPAPDQNHTDLDKATIYLLGEGYDAITMTGVTGDRLDHTFAAIALVCRYKARLVDDVGQAVCVAGPGMVEVPTFAGQIVSLLPCGLVSGLTTVNLKWNLRGAEFNFAERDGTSNQATSDFAQVFVQSGMVVVYAHHPADSREGAQ